MKTFVSLVALAVASFVHAQSPAFTPCGVSPADMTVTEFTLSPYPFCPGQTMCVTVTGSLTAPIDGPDATLVITGKFLHRVVYYDSMDLCDVVSCPISVDTTEITICRPALKATPPTLTLEYQFHAVNGSGNDLFYQQANMTAVSC